MDFLKNIFGAEALTFEQFSEKLKDNKDVKLANLASGQYVDKGKLDAKITELNTANQTIKDLQDAVKKFDGVDVEELKTSLSNLQKQYDTDISAARLDNALNLALAEAKAKNPKLAKGALDMSLLKLDGDKLLGFDEQIKKLKESDGYLFEEDKAPGRIETGLEHKDSLDGDIDKFAAAAMKGAGLNTEKG